VKGRMENWLLVGAVVMGFFSCVLPASAQNAPPSPRDATDAAKPTPRMPDGHPDLTGFWVAGVAGFPNYGNGEDVGKASNLSRTADGSVLFNYGGGVGGQSAQFPAAARREVSEPSYKPEYAAKVKEIQATMNGNATSLDPQQQCKPLGVPRAGLGIDEHVQIIQNPKAIAFLWEADPGPIYRVIYTDGRQHPKDLDTSYLGNSIGHWEGDTLVVDVVGLNDETWLGGGTQGPKGALIHSDKEHVVERWTRTGDFLTYEATVEDPVMFTKPWVRTPQHSHIAAADDYIQPEMCVNNDREHLVKPTE
jgi:hypothetical protein